MSVIAAKVLDNGIKITADSIIVKGYTKSNKDFNKLIKVNDMVIGGVGSAQEVSFMWHYAQTHKPAAATEKDILTFIIEFTQWKSNMGAGHFIENSYLIIFKNHLYEIENMFVHEISDYVAIGAGEDFATAALYLGHSPEEAVKTACELSCFVTEPIISFFEKFSKEY